MSGTEVPRARIEWLIDRLSVAVSDEDVAADIRRRASGPEWSDATRDEAVAVALARHAANRRLYREVMG